MLNTDVLPLFESHGASIQTVLSDNAREFCRRADQHPCELFLQLEGVEHRRTKVRRSQSNGFSERLHLRLLDEHFRIAARSTWYETIEAMQNDLDTCFVHYNTKRPHQGRLMNGKPPAEMFLKGLPKTKKAVEPTAEEMLAQAA